MLTGCSAINDLLSYEVEIINKTSKTLSELDADYREYDSLEDFLYLSADIEYEKDKLRPKDKEIASYFIYCDNKNRVHLNIYGPEQTIYLENAFLIDSSKCADVQESVTPWSKYRNIITDIEIGNNDSSAIIKLSTDFDFSDFEILETVNVYKIEIQEYDLSETFANDKMLNYVCFHEGCSFPKVVSIFQMFKGCYNLQTCILNGFNNNDRYIDCSSMFFDNMYKFNIESDSKYIIESYASYFCEPDIVLSEIDMQTEKHNFSINNPYTTEITIGYMIYQDSNDVIYLGIGNIEMILPYNENNPYRLIKKGCYDITSSDKPWRFYQKYINKIYINSNCLITSNTFTTMDLDHWFRDMDALTDVVIGPATNKNDYINLNYAFDDCDNLKSVIIDSSWSDAKTIMMQRTFKRCKNLEYLQFYGSEAFFNMNENFDCERKFLEANKDITVISNIQNIIDCYDLHINTDNE